MTRALPPHDTGGRRGLVSRFCDPLQNMLWVLLPFQSGLWNKTLNLTWRFAVLSDRDSGAVSSSGSRNPAGTKQLFCYGARGPSGLWPHLAPRSAYLSTRQPLRTPSTAALHAHLLTLSRAEDGEVCRGSALPQASASASLAS